VNLSGRKANQPSTAQQLPAQAEDTFPSSWHNAFQISGEDYHPTIPNSTPQDFYGVSMRKYLFALALGVLL
jgi:hypothetical protein